MNWIGIAFYDNVIKLLYKQPLSSNLWLITPRLIQQDLGPKYADPRIIKLLDNNNKVIANYIGYTRLAPQSNTPKIADYYVRSKLLQFKPFTNIDPYTTSYNFGSNDIGCFPSEIKYNYNTFQPSEINKQLEYFFDISKLSKHINPHKSHYPLIPNSIQLNGFEVSFNKNDTNENHNTHISTKNIVQLQHINYLKTTTCFVDFSPPNYKYPILSIMNTDTQKVIHTDKLLIPPNFECITFRGSTPFIQYNNVWFTIVHKRYDNPLNYVYKLLIFDSKTIPCINNTIPHKCIKEINIDTSKIHTSFIYITGLIIDTNQSSSNNLDILLSFGINDSYSGIYKLILNIPYTNYNSIL